MRGNNRPCLWSKGELVWTSWQRVRRINLQLFIYLQRWELQDVLSYLQDKPSFPSKYNKEKHRKLCVRVQWKERLINWRRLIRVWRLLSVIGMFLFIFFTFNSIDDIAKYFNCKLLNINMYDKILLKHFFLCLAIVLEWSLLYPRLQYYGRLHKWQELQEMDLRTNQNGARGSEYWSC